MEKITVRVSTKHFKGNDFRHQRGHSSEYGADASQVRRCPLEEALVDAGYPDAIVQYKSVHIDNHIYDIDIDTWNEDIVNILVKKANEGQEVFKILTFNRIDSDY